MTVRNKSINIGELVCDNCGDVIVSSRGHRFETETAPDGSLMHFHLSKGGDNIHNVDCKSEYHSKLELAEIRKKQNLQPTDIIGKCHYCNRDISRAEELTLHKDNEGNTYCNIACKRTENVDRNTGQDTQAIRNSQRENAENLKKKKEEVLNRLGLTQEEFYEMFK